MPDTPQTARPGPGGGRRDTVQSVERSFDVLNALAASGVPMSAPELARLTGLNRTVVHRLLRVLARLGLARESHGRYQLGEATAHLGYAYVDSLPLRRPALMYGTDLGLQIADKPWMISLAAPICGYVMLIDRIWEAKTPLSSILDIGTRLEFDGSALGRTMLAYMDEADAVRLIGQQRFSAVAGRLAAIRGNNGVDIAIDEVQPGVVGVAAVIRYPHGPPAGAIAIAGPSSDRDLADSQETVQRVRRTAMNIERALPGYSQLRAMNR